jgi:hypothetical protein
MDSGLAGLGPRPEMTAEGMPAPLPAHSYGPPTHDRPPGPARNFMSERPLMRRRWGALCERLRVRYLHRYLPDDVRAVATESPRQ